MDFAAEMRYNRCLTRAGAMRIRSMSAKDQDATLLNAEAAQVQPRQVALGLLYRGREYQINAGAPPFVIGRDEAACDLCVSSEYGSRRHCTIEYRDGKFVLHDKSTNGTFLQLGRAENLRVHNETVPLIGHGCFQLGRDFRPADPDLIHFVIREARR
jgi:pSer/pThr/pTyr-binding forkhead associated (FHA) protein